VFQVGGFDQQPQLGQQGTQGFEVGVGHGGGDPVENMAATAVPARFHLQHPLRHVVPGK